MRRGGRPRVKDGPQRPAAAARIRRDRACCVRPVGAAARRGVRTHRHLRTAVRHGLASTARSHQLAAFAVPAAIRLMAPNDRARRADYWNIFTTAGRSARAVALRISDLDSPPSRSANHLQRLSNICSCRVTRSALEVVDRRAEHMPTAVDVTAGASTARQTARRSNQRGTAIFRSSARSLYWASVRSRASARAPPPARGRSPCSRDARYRCKSSREGRDSGVGPGCASARLREWRARFKGAAVPVDPPAARLARATRNRQRPRPWASGRKPSPGGTGRRGERRCSPG